MYSKLLGLILFFLHPLISNAEVFDLKNIYNKENQREVLSLSMDNDLFAPARSDRDYTAGIAVTYQATNGRGLTESLDNALDNLDEFFHVKGAKETSIFEIGSFGFTPDTIQSNKLDTSDRPYSSLFYLSASHIYRDGIYGNAWTSTLSLGMLGLDIFKGAQTSVHRLLGGDKANGWDNQVSEGGELTARFHLAYHDNLGEDDLGNRTKIKASYFGSIGYLSEAGVALSFRNGLISSPDHRFNPAITSYGEQSSASESGYGSEESYFWGGIGLKFRLYNAFLEGQLRDSVHTLEKSRLRPFIAEFWAGYTVSLLKQIKLSYVFRAHTSEIKNGTGDRHLMWGGFILSKTIN